LFVCGLPGSTSRQNTVAQLELERDVLLPRFLAQSRRRLAFLREWAKRGPEQARMINADIFAIENGLKAVTGQLAGLQDRATMSKKQEDERAFRALIASRPEWQQKYGSAWDDVANVVKLQRERAALATRTIFGADELTSRARQILRVAMETAKPDAERLNGYHDSQL